MLRQYRLQQDRLELLASYDRLVVASRHMADEYAKHGLQDKVRVVPLPIESAYAPHASVEDDGTWRLLYLGRLEAIKGAHIAVESAAIVAVSSGRPVHLQVSGNGSLRGRLQQQAVTLVGRHSNLTITITGWLREEQCADAMSWANALLVPSCWPEPFGMVGIEAAQHGVPTVAFAVGGIPEWLTDGVNGRLVPADPPDSVAFAKAITACLTDSQMLNRMRAGSRVAAQRFGLDAHVRHLETVLAEVR
jgi:glycosyltransferase involved in cell wall biosynthesis